MIVEFINKKTKKPFMVNLNNVVTIESITRDGSTSERSLDYVTLSMMNNTVLNIAMTYDEFKIRMAQPLQEPQILKEGEVAPSTPKEVDEALNGPKPSIGSGSQEIGKNK